VPLQKIPGDMIGAGGIVQVLNTVVGSVATGTTLIPADDTIPQNTEGDQYMTLSITPKATTNKLRIDVVLIGSHSVISDFWAAALFKDSDANALAASQMRVDSAGPRTVSFTHYMDAGTVSAITFKVRAGGNSAGTFTFNGTGGARRMGGVMASSITITEIGV
jgi:hypothetical protein